MYEFLTTYELVPQFAAACFGLFAVTAILAAGWFTRTPAVVLLSIGVALFATVGVFVLLAFSDVNVLALALDLFVAEYNGAELSAREAERTFMDLAPFGPIAGLGTIVVLLAVWATIRLWRTGRGRLLFAAAPQRSDVVSSRREYDRDWLLSLLQQKAAHGRERVSNPSAPSPTGETGSFSKA